jgi:1,4-alpha-glucan branching enzyme
MTSITRDGSVEFRFFRPGARMVAVMGDFNEWGKDALTMCDDGGGWWVGRLRLRHGEYRFRYLADGQWYTDYASYGVESGKTGFTSVLVTPQHKGHDMHEPARQVA